MGKIEQEIECPSCGVTIQEIRIRKGTVRKTTEKNKDGRCRPTTRFKSVRGIYKWIVKAGTKITKAEAKAFKKRLDKFESQHSQEKSGLCSGKRPEVNPQKL